MANSIVPRRIGRPSGKAPEFTGALADSKLLRSGFLPAETHVPKERSGGGSCAARRSLGRVLRVTPQAHLQQERS